MMFEPFAKIPRLKRDCVITEKIDGTNASVLVTEEGNLWVGSRNRWISPASDNFGFAQFVEANRDTFLALGPGRHFGEWWGPGIQRGYGQAERRFSLFNTGRWNDETVPEGLYVVPVIYHGPFDTAVVDNALELLRERGSVASPGFMRPEGVIVYMLASRTMHKVTLENDELPKYLATA